MAIGGGIDKLLVSHFCTYVVVVLPDIDVVISVSFSFHCSFPVTLILFCFFDITIVCLVCIAL